MVIGGGAGAAPSTTTTGTGVVTALGVNTGTAGAFVVNGGALGSPSSVGTMPAFTLGGTVSGGGNQINNVVIGTTTPLAGNFTSLSATGASSLAVPITLTGSGADPAAATRYIGSGTSSGYLFYNTPTGADHRMTVNGTVVSITSSTGLAVTGTLSATGNATLNGAIVLDGTSINSFFDNDPSAYIFRTGGGAGDFNSEAGHLVLQPRGSTGAARSVIIGAGATTTSEVARFSSTGLAVTGTLSATSIATFGTSGATDTQLRLGPLDAPNTYFQAISADGTTAKGYVFYNGSSAGMTLDSSGNLGIGTTSPSTYGKLAVNSTAAAGANVAITKENSGTANQNGQVLFFNNSHPAATGRNANVVAGQIVWQFSQPSSGALQYAGEIAVLSDSQGGASTASSLNLYSSGGLGLTINSGGNTVIASTLSGGTSGTGYSFSGSAPATSLTLGSSGNVSAGSTLSHGKIGSFLSDANTTFSSLGYGMLSLMNSSSTNNNYTWMTFNESNQNYVGAIGTQNINHSGASASVYGDLLFATKTNGLGGFPTEKMRLDSSGNLTISNGNLIVGTAGKGIDFSVTSSGSGTMTSELLDDYEEGTWTPAFVSTGATFAYTSQFGSYVKVGNLVTLQMHLRTSSITGTTTNATNITGLPFSSANLNADNDSAGAIGLCDVSGGLAMTIANNQSIIFLWNFGVVAQPTALSISGKYLLATITYRTA